MADGSRADHPPDAVAVDGDLARGRESAQQKAWAPAYESLSRASRAGPLAPEDLELLATAAYLIGRVEDCQRAMQRAHQAYADAGNPQRAARMLFWLAFTLQLGGKPAQAAGWLGRTGRLLEREQEGAEHGLMLLPRVIQEADNGAYEEASTTAARMVDIGSRTGDIEVLSLGLHWQGRVMVRQGQVVDGLALLDESMTAVVAGEVAPHVAGSLYCSMIDACREIADMRRAHEWTVALTTWCEQQPDVYTFSGQCLAHRAEIMQVHGQWPEAVELGEPGAPGPFAFADGERVRKLVAAGGFTDVTVESVTRPQRLGADPKEAATAVMALEETRELLEGTPEGTHAKAAAALKEAFAPYAGPSGVVLDAAAWLVSANS